MTDLINNIVKEGCFLDDWRKRIGWFLHTFMALYKDACTVVITDAGISESFNVKIGLHQGLVLSPLLFAVVMDVVSSEARSGLPSELLMAPTMEQLGRRVGEW